MFVKYFDLIKNLFESVFKNSGSEVSFLDYLYVLGYTFALIGILIVFLCVFAGIIVLPVFVHKKILKKDRAKIKDLQLKIIKTTNPMEVFETSKNIANLDKKIRKKNVYFSVGIIFLYIPFVIPTILFLINRISMLF